MRTAIVLLGLAFATWGDAAEDQPRPDTLPEAVSANGSKTEEAANEECPTRAPILVAPRTVDNRVDLHWQGPQDRYSIEIDAGDRSDRFETLGSRAERHLPPGHYSVRVRGIACQTLPGRWSHSAEFTIGNAADAPPPAG
jgi:hypothetical protein